MRLSKFLSLSVAMSRNQAKFFIRKGRVSVGGNLVTDPNLELSDTSDIIFDGKRISIIPYSYILLHKPKSYVCVTRKSDYTSVLELLKSRSEDRYYHFANVLDADLTGMVLLSDNAHWTTRMRRKLQSKMCVYQVGLKQAFNEIQLNKISEAVLAHSEGQIGAAIYIQKEDEIKFVIANKEDYDWSKKMIKNYNLNKICPILFSPVYNKIDISTLADWILEDGLNVKLQMQLHKHIWGEKKGV